MAYINVAEWCPDQVTDWLKGLDSSMHKYIHSFANNEIKGQTLLNIRPYELEELGMASIGHQEIILEAVEQLRNFNYNLEKENLQFLALRVATTTKNLHNQLANYPDKTELETQILNDIIRAVATVKPLVGWLDRSPFLGQQQFNELRKQISDLGIQMAFTAQRDQFVKNPVDQIRLMAEKLAKLADYIIQDITDPIILQPGTLNLVTLKKREQELGFNIVPNYHGIHVITDMKYNSPAHVSGKIEDGDEIIQINYQTVVGWDLKRVLEQLKESPTDVLLTLKKRPRHTKIYGQIYMKPYRLPSKKRSLPYRFSENLPSPRIELMPSQNFPMLMPLPEKNNLTDTDSSSASSISIPAEPTKTNDKDLRLYLPKPRAVLQRRNTICGDQAAGFRGNIRFLHEINIRQNVEGNSLRDKSVSFGFGLERPTVIGIHSVGTTYQHDKYGDLGNALKGSLPDIKTVKNNSSSDQTTTIKMTENDVNDNKISTNGSSGAAGDNGDNGDIEATDRQDVKSKVVKFNTTHDIIGNTNGIVNMIDSIPYADASDVNETEDESKGKYENSEMAIKLNGSASSTATPKLPLKMKVINAANDTGLAEAINITLIKNQHRSNDITSNQTEEDKPPEIGPRKEFLKKIAPKPPPRPSKAAELVQRKFDMLKSERMINNNTDVPHSPHQNVDFHSEMARESNLTSSPSLQRVILSTKTDDKQTPPKPIVPPKLNMDDQNEESELLTPNKTKTLTLKKKNSILAKRRKICLKTLEISDIQGHLFRRMKDKHGVTYWAKYYFVMVETALYGFRNKRSQKASCLIFLPGFTISLAKEVHSKPFAYKVYHPKKTFYFAAETEQALGQWMEYIRRATLKGSAANIDPMLIDNVNTRDLFSETDSSEDENEFDDVPQVSSFKHALLGGGRKKRGSVDDTGTATAPKSEKYHLGFGSLKKFTNLHNLPFTSSKSDKEREERKKAQSDIPVPTAQFRSYRKIPGNAGMQLGSSTILPMDYNLMVQRSPQNHILNTLPSMPSTILEQIPSPKAIEVLMKPVQKVDVISQTMHQPTTPNPPVPIKTLMNSSTNPPTSTLQQHKIASSSSSSEQQQYLDGKKISKLAKTKTLPFNYMHASNPNLVEFTFQTSKALDVGLPKVNASNTFDPHQNPQNMITLKDLMLQREEDEAHNMYNNRVNLGVEKQNDRQMKRKHRRANDTAANENNRTIDENENTPQNGQKSGVPKIQSRSLPKTPDYAQSFKTDDSEIIMARSKEGQKLRDFGYEFITGDDLSNGNVSTATTHSSLSHNNQSKKPAIQPKPSDRFLLSSKRKGLNWIGLSSDKRNDDEKLLNKGSFKLNKQKGVDSYEVNRSKNETYRPVLNRFINRDPHSHSHSHPHSQYSNKLDNEAFQTTTNPLNAFAANHRSDVNASTAFLVNGDRKPSTVSTIQTSYLSKLTFPTTKTAKEKRLLGSPRLHRAASSLFGRKTSDASSYEHEMFAPIGESHAQNKYSLNNDTFPTTQQLHNSSTINSNYLPSTTITTSSSSFSVSEPQPQPQPQLNNEMKIGANKIILSNESGLTNQQPTVGIPQHQQQHIFVPSSCPNNIINNTIQDQNIEYPPVFEPETYSLCDPHASLKLIRRRTINRNNNTNNNNNK